MTLDNPHLLAILGQRKETYIPRFERLLAKAQGVPTEATKTWSWNWAAFVFGGFWLLYHRLYWQGLGFLTLSMFLPEVFGPQGYAVIFAGNVVLGLYGDAQLFRHCALGRFSVRRWRMSASKRSSTACMPGGRWPCPSAPSRSFWSSEP